MSVQYVANYTLPIELFGKALGIGANLLIASESKNGTVPQATWRTQARAAGFKYIDTPMTEDDCGDPSLIGWIIPNSDEWNRPRGNPPMLPAVGPLQLWADTLAGWNAKHGTKKLIMANADGMHVTAALWEKPPYPGITGNEKALMPRLSLRFSDWHVVANTTPGQEGRRPLWLPAQSVWRMRTWNQSWGSPTSLYGSFVEAAHKAGAPLSVTPAQMQTEVDHLTGVLPFDVPDANAQPVKATENIDILCWWTANGQSGPGWNWWASDPDQEAMMKTITGKLLSGTPNTDQRLTLLETQMAAMASTVSTMQGQMRTAGLALAAPA
jgi:hypothetical protein